MSIPPNQPIIVNAPYARMLLCQLVARFTISLIQFLRLITFKSFNSASNKLLTFMQT